MGTESKNKFLTASELDIFTIPGFSERMTEIKTRISPKLGLLGEEVVNNIQSSKGVVLFPHVAKHARRVINPPDETWVALSPSPRGYKMHAHLAIGVGYYGAFVKCVAKSESAEKALLAQAVNKLKTNRSIWIIKGDNPVEADLESVLEVIDHKSYGLEIGVVIPEVPGETLAAWLDWTLKELKSLWPLYNFVREKV